jgi:enoyl-CoA hydratase/carnithine racemase
MRARRPPDSTSPIRVERDAAIACITLCRPERLNAFTPAMGVALFETIAQLDRDDDVRAIVVTGEGRAFCAGADLEAGADTFASDDTWEDAHARESRAPPWRLVTPIIAAINGPAVGVGATLPLWWDIRIASDRARIGFVFTRRGIIPEAGSTWILPRLIGMSAALDLLITGRMLSAHEALRLGLVSRVVPHDELMETALRTARDIAENTAPVSVAITKRLVWRQLFDSDPTSAREVEEALFRWVGKQPDAAEGVQSFLEKRPPRWSMRPQSDLPLELSDEFRRDDD